MSHPAFVLIYDFLHADGEYEERLKKITPTEYHAACSAIARGQLPAGYSRAANPRVDSRNEWPDGVQEIGVRDGRQVHL